MTADERQKAVMKWAVSTFGPVAEMPVERAMRLVEEAIEICQCYAVDKSAIVRIVDRVYSRPCGELHQEIGGVAITLDALAENAGWSVTTEAEREFDRITSLPREHFRKKQTAKAIDGTAGMPS